MQTTEHPSVESYAEHLHRRLVIFGISFGDLARETRIQRAQISRWINERAYPNARSIARLERGLESLVGRGRIAELERFSVSNNVAEIAEPSPDIGEVQQKAVIHYAKVELFRGAADGEVWFLQAVLSDLVTVATKDIDGNPIMVTYEKCSADPDKLVAYVETGDTREDRMALERAFQGSAPARYAYVDPTS